MSKEIPASTIKRILIIEDTPNDISYYRSLFHIGKEVHLLFLARESTFTKDKLVGLIDLIYEDIAPKIANYYVCAEDGLVEFLKTNLFDFYVADSLGGNAITLISEVGLSKDIVVFLSSTTSFREVAWDKGYRAYKKENIDELINDCLVEHPVRK